MSRELHRVFVTQEAGFNFVDAERYGELIFIARDDLWMIKDSAHNESVMLDIAARLRDFDPENDWIVIAGSPYISAAIFLQLGNKGVRSVRVLRWDRQTSKYQPLYLQLRREI